MVIRKPFAIAVAAGLAFLASLPAAQAFDPDKTFKPDDSPEIILKYGYNALKDGRHGDAIGAFRLNVEKDHLPSQWKLARIYQLGDGVPQDHLAAYGLFEKIANRYAEIPPNRIDKPYVSSAVVELGHYSLTGIKGSRIKRDPQLAEFLFYRAGALYGDAEAQFQLGRLYNSKSLGRKRPRNAARWFELASKKGHPDAQAQLGDMLFHGKGVRKNRVRALVYLTKAAAGSARGSFARITKLQLEAFAKANEAQRKAARKIIAGLRLKRRSNEQASGNGGLRVFGLSAESMKVTESDN